MSDYDSTHVDTNGKVFRLAKTKSPEEIRREELSKSMPKFRRAASSKRMPMQAKWLHNQLTDDSFMFDFGGDGHGTVITTIKQIADRYSHDRDSISKWLDYLERREMVWIEYEYPFLMIHLTAVLPIPTNKASLVQRLRSKASSARISGAEGVGMENLAAPESKSARNAQENGISEGDATASHAEGVGIACPHLPHRVPTPSARNGGHLPHRGGVSPATRADTSPHAVRVSSARGAGSVGNRPSKSSSGAGENAPLERSPGDRRSGVEEMCVEKGKTSTHTQIPKFEPLDQKCVARLRPQIAEKQIEIIKERMHQVENSRNPNPKRKEIVSAYRSRVKELKQWVVGELV